MTGHVFIAASLDGFIARLDGDIDWLSSFGNENEDNGYFPFMETMDGLIMGRATYEKVLSFGIEWPYDKPVVVLSGSLTDADLPDALRGKVRITAASPTDIVQTLDAEGWKRAYVDGGAVIQSFLREGLIADLRIFRAPILLGEGLPLFGAFGRDIRLEHTGSTPYPSGIVESNYRVIV